MACECRRMSARQCVSVLALLFRSLAARSVLLLQYHERMPND